MIAPMPDARPPRIRIIGTGDSARVTVNAREWDGYMIYIPEERKAIPTIGTHMTETYGTIPDFEMFLIPCEKTKQITRPRKIKIPKKRGRKPKNV